MCLCDNFAVMKRFNSVLLLLLSPCLFAQAPAPQQQPPDNAPPFVKQVRELLKDGKVAEGLVVYQNVLKTEPDSQDANIGAGALLDVMQRGPEARKYFEHAISTAKTD